jgi:hypothetical protein
VRNLLSRCSDWILSHPVRWAVCSGAALILLGVAFDLEPIVVAGVGAGIAILNVVHARRRAYCPIGNHPAPHDADIHDR